MSYHGTTQAQLVRDERSYSHGQGWTTTREHVGGENEIIGLLNGYINDNYEVRTSRDGPYMRLIATRAGTYEYAAKDYYDKFSITKENLQKSIWTVPEVVDEMENFAAAPPVGTGLPRQQYKAWIEDAIDTGDETKLEELLPKLIYDEPFGYAWRVYRELCRGADSYETEYIVLTRERVVSLEYFQTDVMPIPPLNAARIFTSSLALKAVFNIPDLPGVVWPDEATALTNSATDLQWGWRERRREIRFQEGARVEVVQDWTFAEWSTNLYSTV